MSKLKLDYCLVCEYASSDATGRLLMVGIFDKIESQKFPATHPQLYLVATFSVLDKESEYFFNLIVEDEKGVKLPVNMPNIKAEFKKDVEEPKITLLIKIPLLLLPEEGKYLFKIYHEEKEVGKAEVHAIKLRSN